MTTNSPTIPNRRERLPLWFLVSNWLLVLVAFTAGVLLGRRSPGGLPEPQATALRLVLNQIVESHVDPQDPKALLERGISSIVEGLDEYSRYIPPEESAGFDEDMTGTYEGVGLVCLPRGGDYVIRFPMAGGPAEHAGLRPGDVITAVDGKKLARIPDPERAERAGELLRGKAGTRVVLAIRREGASDFDVELVRGSVTKPSIRWARLLDEKRGIGYARISDFHSATASDLRRTIEDLAHDAGGSLKGLVLDLRWNGGGLLDQCVAVARLFLSSGNIVTTKRRGSVVAEQSFDAIPSACVFPDLPLAVLVNGYTASASEVLAGALQDHRRASIVGTRTFGKGVVNTIYRWRDLAFRLKLTTARYFTPSGRNLDRMHGKGHDASEGGIEPDILVEIDGDASREIHEALETGHEVPRDLWTDVAELDRKLGIEERRPLGPEKDRQLARAVETLLEGGGRGGGGTPR
ncbi:MAG: hypothetical protein Fur0037_12010 [Planctomycetota bacterium]